MEERLRCDDELRFAVLRRKCKTVELPELDVSCRERIEVRFPLARESPDRYVSNDSPQLLLEIAQRLFFLRGKRIAGLGDTSTFLNFAMYRFRAAK